MNASGDGGGLARRLRRALLGALAACLLLPAVAAATDSVAMFSEPGDYIGQGEQRLFHEGNASLTVQNGYSGVEVSVSGGTHGDYFTLDFAAPPGEELRPGVYENAQRAAFRQSGRPGLSVHGDGRGCNTLEGRFEVKEFERALDGSVRRLWVVFEQHCEGDRPALFGEVRVGLSDPHPTAVGLPQHVRWPGLELGARSTAVPASLVASGPLPVLVREVRLEGEHAGEFSVRSDECTARTVAPGQACQVWLRAVPRAAGPRSGRLVLVDDTGARHVVALEAHAFPGRTGVLLRSDHDDYVGAGRDWPYTPADSAFEVTGSRSHVRFRVFGAGGEYWDANFEAPAGDILAPGRYLRATRYPFNETGAGLEVVGQSRACNRIDGEFTVTEATFESDGSPKTFGVVFEQRCEEGEGGALRGAMEFRVDDSTPPPDVPAGSKAPSPEQPSAQPPPEPEPAAPPQTGTPSSSPPPGPSGQPPTGAPPSATSPPRAPLAIAHPAKLQVERARVSGGRLDVLARITRRARGEVTVAYRAAGRTVRFPARIEDGIVRIDRRLSGGQRRLSTGIVTLGYPGAHGVRPDRVRLRAASRPARLKRQVTRISDGRLQVAGTISGLARGVVRVRIGFQTAEGVRFVEFQAPIRNGRWRLDQPLAGRAASGGELSLQYTGDFARRVGGEQDAKQIP